MFTSLRTEIFARTFLSFVAFFGALFVPWWIPFICMLALSLRFTAWEVPLLGLWMDFVWLPHVGFPLFAALGITMAFAASPLRRQLLL